MNYTKMCDNWFIKDNKVNILMGGQFGSEGKGAVANWIAKTNPGMDAVAARISPNSGHTFYMDGEKHVVRQFPVSAIVNPNTKIYFSPESVIDYHLFNKEKELYDIDDKRIWIHPRAAVIEPDDSSVECRNTTLTGISSTCSGTGVARVAKIMREHRRIAIQHEELKEYVIRNPDSRIAEIMTRRKAFVETSQGFDLSLNYGFHYPHVTSTDITTASVLAGLPAHPEDLGNVMLVFRAYPIRVGNGGGYSGDTWFDSKEIDFSDIGVAPEYTTVTNRKRRLFTFSKMQYAEAIRMIRPTHVLINFVNYIPEKDIHNFFIAVNRIRRPDFIMVGHEPEDVAVYNRFMHVGEMIQWLKDTGKLNTYIRS